MVPNPFSADQQTAVEALAASAGRMDKRVEIASVVRAFPALATAAPVAVMLQAGRLHMQLGRAAHACCFCRRAWSQQPHSCERHDALEMLAFTCHPASDADVSDGAQLSPRNGHHRSKRFSTLNRKQTNDEPWNSRWS
jgi:hypothetical protein